MLFGRLVQLRGERHDRGSRSQASRKVLPSVVYMRARTSSTYIGTFAENSDSCEYGLRTYLVDIS